MSRVSVISATNNDDKECARGGQSALTALHWHDGSRVGQSTGVVLCAVVNYALWLMERSN